MSGLMTVCLSVLSYGDQGIPASKVLIMVVNDISSLYFSTAEFLIIERV